MTFIQKKLKIIQLLTTLNILYKLKLTDNLIVCSKWPNKCNQYDYHLIDGATFDGPCKLKKLKKIEIYVVRCKLTM